MPPHPQHDAFVGPFHGESLQDFEAVGWAKRSVPTTDQQTVSHKVVGTARSARLCPPYAAERITR